MTDSLRTCEPKVVRCIFLHAEEVTITCPLCGKRIEAEFRRPGPTGEFVPTYVHCPCGRYSYHHSVR